MLSRAEKELPPVIAHCTSAIELEPDPARRARLLATRALAHGLADRPGDVVADASAAIELDPNVPRARMRRAHARLDLGKLAEAEQDCAAALAAAEVEAPELMICAQVARKQKDRALERTRLERALALEPDRQSARFAHAWLNEQEGRLAEAAAIAHRTCASLRYARWPRIGHTRLRRSCAPGDRKSTRLNSSHSTLSRMPSSA